MRKLLIVGAQPDSLGWEVRRFALRTRQWEPYTAGPGEGEDYFLNIRDQYWVEDVIKKQDWHSIVCTAGVNYPQAFVDNDLTWDDGSVYKELMVNALGPMMLLDQWLETKRYPDPSKYGHHFVAISSNSAHIARTESVGYCMSKAALSMGLRCAARELARKRNGFAVYGYEPGWLDGTPMSQEVTQRLPGGVQPHRIPSGLPINTRALARMIVNNLSMPWENVNGMMIRVDGGEQ